MTTTIIGLGSIHFDVRTALGGCLMNINGETYDVVVDKEPGFSQSPTYTVTDKESKAVLCYFRPHHLHYLDDVTFQVEGVSRSGGDGTLIVPVHGMLPSRDDEDPLADG